MNKINYILVIVILLGALGAAYLLPAHKYTSPDMVSRLKIPLQAGNWQGQDIDLGVDLTDERFNFVSNIFSRIYKNKGDELMMIVLDAGNFHHPKVCFSASGFSVQELNDVALTIKGRTIKAKSLLTRKDDDEFVLLFWMCINKKQVNWTEQKIQQLLFSIFNKEKIGLMVRFDIPLRGNDPSYAPKLAGEFLSEVLADMPEEQMDYLFGLASGEGSK